MGLNGTSSEATSEFPQARPGQRMGLYPDGGGEIATPIPRTCDTGEYHGECRLGAEANVIELQPCPKHPYSYGISKPCPT